MGLSDRLGRMKDWPPVVKLIVWWLSMVPAGASLFIPVPLGLKVVIFAGLSSLSVTLAFMLDSQEQHPTRAPQRGH